MPNFDLVLPFDRDSAEYARGVEIGMLYERLRSGDFPVSAIIHETNVEMVLRLKEALGLSVKADDLDGEWLAVEFAEGS